MSGQVIDFYAALRRPTIRERCEQRGVTLPAIPDDADALEELKQRAIARRLLVLLSARTESVRRELAKLREARRAGRSARYIGRQQEMLRFLKQRLGQLPRDFGVKRLPLGRLREAARQDIDAARRVLPGRIRDLESRSAVLQHQLRRGVFVRGAHASEPLTGIRRYHLERELERVDRYLAELRERLERAETEPDPLVAWGLYRRVHRAPLAMER